MGYLEGEENHLTNDDDDNDDKKQPQESYFVSDETDELRNLPEDDRRAAFQAQYKAEVERQKKLLGIRSLDELFPVQDQNDESDDVAWEDG